MMFTYFRSSDDHGVHVQCSDREYRIKCFPCTYGEYVLYPVPGQVCVIKLRESTGFLLVSCMRMCTEPEHKTSRRRQSKTVSKRMKADIILLQFSFQTLMLLMQVLVAIAATGRSGKISATGMNITTY